MDLPPDPSQNGLFAIGEASRKLSPGAIRKPLVGVHLFNLVLQRFCPQRPGADDAQDDQR
jgi:hypothetical protein